MNTLLILFIPLIVNLALATDCVNCRIPQLAPILDVPEWPIEFVKIEKVDYSRNANASFCKRPPEILDTIVLHHSEGPSTGTPESINNDHLQRGTPDDPWYMIAYSYVVNSPYPGATTPRARVTEGRPLDIVGAHAGSDVYVPLDDEQKKMFEEGKIVCGKENGTFEPDPSLYKDGKTKANVTTLGLVVIGNYAQAGKGNLQFGYPRGKPRVPTKTTLDLIARTSCQLQKKYPKIKTIKWHSYYHPTTCPGDLKNYIGQIKAMARTLGCEFN